MSEKKNTVSAKLTRWQQRLADSNHAYSAEVEKMDEREKIYGGDNSLSPGSGGHQEGRRAQKDQPRPQHRV